MNETSEEITPVDIRESGSLTGLMIRFSVPCIISLLVGALYNIIDQIFIANADFLTIFVSAFLLAKCYRELAAPIKGTATNRRHSASARKGRHPSRNACLLNQISLL